MGSNSGDCVQAGNSWCSPFRLLEEDDLDHDYIGEHESNIDYDSLEGAALMCTFMYDPEYCEMFGSCC